MESCEKMLKHKNILIVDDEFKIVEVLKSYLEHEKFNVFLAYNGSDALYIFENEHIDLIILDLMLPDISGEEVCKRIRVISSVPIIILTAKIEESDVLKGLNLGADDYVLKPFSPREVVARVYTILRRVYSKKSHNAKIYEFYDGELIIDEEKYEVLKNGKTLNLTPNEYKILRTLAKQPAKTFTRDELISMSFGFEYDGFDRTIDTHIKNLRYKIENDPKNPKYLKTVHGIGYKFGIDS